MSLIRKDILNIEAYKPGKPIEEVKRELGIKGVIKLASNENPLGPSPKAIKAIARALGNLNRYPEGTCFYLRKKLARRLRIKEENLIFGNGSDELIDIILKTIKEPEANIVTADLTFVEYKITGAINDFSVITVPLKNDTFDLGAIKSAITPKTKAVFIANPNNPTGTYVTAADVAKFLDGIPPDILVVFDEAYLEYVQAKDFPDMIPLIDRRNIAVLRTFSKIYGLAGLRVGYMAASEDFISCCQRVRQPFNVNSLAQAGACAALDDRAFVKKTKSLNAREKKTLYRGLRGFGIRYTESQTNFIFIKLGNDAQDLFAKLLKKGIIIREIGKTPLGTMARITIGTPAENKRLLNGLRKTIRSDNS
jgi:histidinol-phosphate aminotransferase